jgi:hypothetical protein
MNTAFAIFFAIAAATWHIAALNVALMASFLRDSRA